jgi:hypothetical protein
LQHPVVLSKDKSRRLRENLLTTTHMRSASSDEISSFWKLSSSDFRSFSGMYSGV